MTTVFPENHCNWAWHSLRDWRLCFSFKGSLNLWFYLPDNHMPVQSILDWKKIHPAWADMIWNYKYFSFWSVRDAPWVMPGIEKYTVTILLSTRTGQNEEWPKASVFWCQLHVYFDYLAFHGGRYNTCSFKSDWGFKVGKENDFT